MKVLKFGGTSVGTPERMHHIASLIGKERNIIVLSAVSGTTNTLVDITKCCKKQQTAKASTLSDKLRIKHDVFIRKLYKTDKGVRAGNRVLDKQFKILNRAILKTAFGDPQEKIILAQGELISTQLFHHYLNEIEVPNMLLPALDFMRINRNNEPDLDNIRTSLKSILSKNKKKQVFITQGYICRDNRNRISNLKRGGSDYTASIIGAVLKAKEVQIWTDIDGMHNNDPRYVSNTRPVKELSFDEAAELAYFGAKILHPAMILPAKQFKVPVRILNTMEPTAHGTLITKQAKTNKVKAIAAKDQILAIKIKSSRMLLAYGFLRKVFEVFERYKTPIDMITTSEVAVSLTIDDASRLKEIKAELSKYGRVRIDRNQSIICVVGDFLSTTPGTVAKVLDALRKIPLRMVSYGGSDNNLSILLDTKYKSQALNLLNEKIFRQ